MLVRKLSYGRGKPGDRIHLLSGTMVFRYTPNMIKLAKAYVEAVKTGTVWEQQTLQTLVEDRSAKEIRVYSLPAPYCAIVKQDGVTVPEYMCPPCVLHHQASRKLKDRKNWGNA